MIDELALNRLNDTINVIFREENASITQDKRDHLLIEACKGLVTQNSELREKTLDTLWDLISENALRCHERLLVGDTLSAQLQEGIGQESGNLVFLRTFSVILLGRIVAQETDNCYGGQTGCLTQECFNTWLDCLCEYVTKENDYRAYVMGKGWAHARSHMADALRDFAFSNLARDEDLKTLMALQVTKFQTYNQSLLSHNDDNRIARFFMIYCDFGLLEVNEILNDLQELISNFEGQSLLEFMTDDKPTTLWYNCKMLLQAIYFNCHFGMKQIYDKDYCEDYVKRRQDLAEGVQNILLRMDDGLNYQAIG